MDTLIVDDEQHARARLRGMIEEIGTPYRVVGEAGNGNEALAFCRQQPVDLVLMDIRMPGMDGLQAAEALASEELPPAVIFVTAFEEHALEALQNRAVDYLLKPIRRERLKTALDKVAALTRPQMERLQQIGVDSDEKLYISASFRGGLKRIPVEEVACFYADHKYVVAEYGEGEALLEDSLRSLEQQFGERFLRVHRNALIARSRLVGLEKTADGRCFAVLSASERRIEISRRHLAEVRRLLKGRA